MQHLIYFFFNFERSQTGREKTSSKLYKNYGVCERNRDSRGFILKIMLGKWKTSNSGIISFILNEV